MGRVGFIIRLIILCLGPKPTTLLIRTEFTFCLPDFSVIVSVHTPDSFQYPKGRLLPFSCSSLRPQSRSLTWVRVFIPISYTKAIHF